MSSSRIYSGSAMSEVVSSRSAGLRSTVTGWRFKWVPNEKQFPPPPIKVTFDLSESRSSEQKECSMRGQGIEDY